MQNGMKLFWLTGLVSAMGAFAVQGCDDGGDDDPATGGTGGATTGGAAGKGGSAGSATGGAAGKGGSGGSATGGAAGKGGAGGSTGGTGQGGEPPADGGEPGVGGGVNEPSPECNTFCTGNESIIAVCGDEAFFPEEWAMAADCLMACADFGDSLECWNTHRNNAAMADNPDDVTLHCGHATGEPGAAGQCDERQ